MKYKVLVTITDDAGELKVTLKSTPPAIKESDIPAEVFQRAVCLAVAAIADEMADEDGAQVTKIVGKK